MNKLFKLPPVNTLNGNYRYTLRKRNDKYLVLKSYNQKHGELEGEFSRQVGPDFDNENEAVKFFSSIDKNY